MDWKFMHRYIDSLTVDISTETIWYVDRSIYRQTDTINSLEILFTITWWVLLWHCGTGCTMTSCSNLPGAMNPLWSSCYATGQVPLCPGVPWTDSAAAPSAGCHGGRVSWVCAVCGRHQEAVRPATHWWYGASQGENVEAQNLKHPQEESGICVHQFGVLWCYPVPDTIHNVSIWSACIVKGRN